MVESFRLVLDIFKKFHPLIVQASIIKPDVRHQTGQFMPARVHPTTLDTITDAWGHHQLDVYGLFMYKMGDLIKKGYGFRFKQEDFFLLSHIRNYIFNMGFEADYGMWEEGPEDHSSSFGAVLGGLMMWFDQGFYDYKYKHKIDISHYVPISERMIAEGHKSLARLLPRESGTRQYDMSQLSLIWPYNIVSFDMKEILLHNIETNLVGKRGVRRYPGDVYCGKGLVPGFNETAEWPLGLAWLAICYAKLAEHGHDFDHAHKPVHFDWIKRREYFDKAIHYFQLLEKNMTDDGCVPEMYVAHQTGHNTPLAWAQSFHIISGQILTNLMHAHPKEFKLPHEVRHGREH
jgi:phosphorylase kinase alpha/beta subunit